MRSHRVMVSACDAMSLSVGSPRRGARCLDGRNRPQRLPPQGHSVDQVRPVERRCLAIKPVVGTPPVCGTVLALSDSGKLESEVSFNGPRGLQGASALPRQLPSQAVERNLTCTSAFCWLTTVR